MNLPFRIFIFLFFISLLTSACQTNKNVFQGYVDARYTYVSSFVAGRLFKLFVKPGQPIVKKQDLFILEPEPEKSELEEAGAEVLKAEDQLASAQAALELANITLKRRSFLEKKEALDRQTVDESRANQKEALANKLAALNYLKAKEAAFEKTKWRFSEKTISSKKNALVFDTYFIPGESIPANTPVLSLLSKEDIYVVFYVSGLKVNQIQLGQSIKILPAGTKKAIPAKISYISPSAEYAPPVIYSNETNHKLVFRIEAIPLQPTYQLHPGAPVALKF
jgi:HlyD family secretion protein